MKGTIKIIIALVFILGSYFLGSYRAKEDCSMKESNLREQIASKEKELYEMKDSLFLTKKELLECSVNKMNTMKIQSIDSLTNKIKNDDIE